MATFRKSGNKWRAEICKYGARLSKSFSTKLEAQSWATREEARIISGNVNPIANKTFGDLLRRYVTQVTPTKAGEKWETTRINAMLRDEISDTPLVKLSQPDFAAWRDRRLQAVTPATVRREWNILSNACNRAVMEWRWLQTSPIKGVVKPKPPEARDRMVTPEEIDRLMFQFGSNLHTVTGRVGQVFLFALETAMRCGEICALTWDVIDLDRRVLRVLSGKTSAARRDVALSEEAVRILAQFAHNQNVFNVNETQVDALFRKAKSNALIEGLHFHDSRATALTRLSKKLGILALARMVGHKDLKMLQVYYRESAEDIAKLL